MKQVDFACCVYDNVHPRSPPWEPGEETLLPVHHLELAKVGTEVVEDQVVERNAVRHSG